MKLASEMIRGRHTSSRKDEKQKGHSAFLHFFQTEVERKDRMEGGGKCEEGLFSAFQGSSSKGVTPNIYCTSGKNII